jgi:hypothetical protein
VTRTAQKHAGEGGGGAGRFWAHEMQSLKRAGAAVCWAGLGARDVSSAGSWRRPALVVTAPVRVACSWAAQGGVQGWAGACTGGMQAGEGAGRCRNVRRKAHCRGTAAAVQRRAEGEDVWGSRG